MAFFRTILTLLALAVFTAGAAGVPTLVHLCGGEPVAEACDPQECCSDEPETTDDGCCTDQVLIHNVDEDAAVTSAPSLPAPTEFHSVVAPDLQLSLLNQESAASETSVALPDRHPPSVIRTNDRLAQLDIFLI